MIVVRSQYASLIDNLLNQFQMEDPKEIFFAIEALQSIVDPDHAHSIAPSLKDRIQEIQKLITHLPVQEVGAHALKLSILMKVSQKIELLQKKAQTHEALIRLQKYEFEEIEKDHGILDLYIPLQGQEDRESAHSFDLFIKVIEFIESPSHHCLLLTGDACAGKTTFIHYLANYLWKSHKKGIQINHPIPVIIHLHTIAKVEEELLSEHLANQGLNAEEIRLLKSHATFIFILDGYDTLGITKNLFQTNRLDNWKCKVVITCRSQGLSQEAIQSRFESGLRDDVLQKVSVSPFAEKEIKKTITQYLEHHKDQNWKESHYWNILSKFPSVLALCSHPFILSATMAALPILAQKYVVEGSEDNNGPPLYKKMADTQCELYDAIVNAWLDRQIKKLGELEKLELKNGTLLTKEDFIRFNHEMALQMALHKSMKVTISNTEDEKIQVLCYGSLLKNSGDKTYTFFHDSLRAHFASKQTFHGIYSYTTFAIGHALNDKLLVCESELLDLLAAKIKVNPNIEKLLFSLIDASKNEPIFTVAAANAITLLNRIGVTFSGLDLSHVRIEGADLSRGVLDGVDFTNADLRHVKLMDANITQVNFSGACMDGIQLGQVAHKERQKQGFKCDKTTIAFVTGLSQQNLALLQQCGASGQVLEESSEEILTIRNQRETVDTSCSTIFGFLPGGDRFGITSRNWVLSLACLKDSEHPQLILEGIENKQRAIYQIQVPPDRKNSSSITQEYVSHVVFKPISRHATEELAKRCTIQSKPITKIHVDKLKELTKKEKNIGKGMALIQQWLTEIKVELVHETWPKELLSLSDNDDQQKQSKPNDNKCSVQ